MQLHGDFKFINEEFHAATVSPAQLDLLLANGWRHFGNYFFRYNLGIYEDQLRHVLPLRVQLSQFSFSKSQRRVLRQNADLSVDIGTADITDEIHELFDRHKQRFKSGVPHSIFDFISTQRSEPIECGQLTVRLNGRIVAASFFDEGDASLSSIYALFDPAEIRRSLGIFTMLKEIEHARDRSRRFYYHGYAYDGESYYDYKKRLAAIEAFDWHASWRALTP
jgi:leucyl-tRNA---protein transferase